MRTKIYFSISAFLLSALFFTGCSTAPAPAYGPARSTYSQFNPSYPNRSSSQPLDTLYRIPAR